MSPLFSLSMKIEKITDWLDKTLNVSAFDDVSNNGVQIASTRKSVNRVAFAVDGSAKAVAAAADAGAGLLVVHHGISWAGGIRRIEGGVYNVVKRAIDSDIALYVCHLPLDAHSVLGNNAQLAHLLGLTRTRAAFNYHGNVIGLVGESRKAKTVTIGRTKFKLPCGKVGVCSGGAGDFAEEAKRLGCELFITGEASWGDVIAAENCGMKMVCCGHYETEVFGVRAVAAAMKRALGVEIVDLTEEQI